MLTNNGKRNGWTLKTEMLKYKKIIVKQYVTYSKDVLYHKIK